ncbi:ATP-binding protein [Micromonospora sp. MW-13]|uniref:ATP-binding protein n=1 Tax=Micromonospora sp. MW-13 TaxID=2094022 RepID=UPI00352C1CDE
MVGPASVVLSELVGNVVRHAGTPMRVTLTLRRSHLQVAVTDGSHRTLRPAARTDPRAEGGAGCCWSASWPNGGAARRSGTARSSGR